MVLGNKSLGTHRSIPAPSPITFGFTLIELLVSLTIFATLAYVMLVIFSPLTQITKGQNSQRQRDLDQVRTALDTYYNDTGCYPKSLSFGSKWSVGSVVYMQKLPQDILCSQNGAYCYRYETDNAACPQWNILFGTMQAPVGVNTTTCRLASLASCQPINYAGSGVNYCLTSGDLGCAYISSNNIVTGGEGTPSSSSSPTPTPGGGGGGPTPTPSGCSPKNWSCTGGGPGIPQICNVVPAGTGTYCTPNCDGACQ